METMIKEYIATLIRNLIAPLVAILAASGYITENDAAQFGIAVAALAVAVIWGLVNKYLWKKTTEAALAAPATKSESKLEDVIAGGK